MFDNQTMKSIDPLLYRQKTDDYSCVNFVIEAGQTLLNYDYSPHFLGMSDSLLTAKPTRQVIQKSKKTTITQDGVVAVMTRLDARLHVGLCYDNKILHLTENGVKLQTSRTLSRLYTRIRYYEPIKQ